MLKFEVKSFEGKARVGVLETAHGFVETPTFMAVGTRATVKAMTPEMIKETGTKIVLGNTYHLMLRPGQERIKRFGGLHKFMRWNGPILTDSGGFQVMSLSGLRKITEEGVVFASHIDGTRYLLSPEKSIEIQHDLDADISMAFDECVENPAPYQYVKNSHERTIRWLKRCRAEMDRLNAQEGTVNPHQMLFGINQGGTYEDLRIENMLAIREIECDGYAIGGLAVGESADVMYHIIETVEPYMPVDKPRYLMGVGTPQNIVEAVYRGVDFFDCVMPSRNARHGNLFTWKGKMNLLNEKYAEDSRPIAEECGCPACRNYSRSYIRHLFKAREALGMRLAVLHNLYFYNELMQKIRDALDEGRYEEFYHTYVDLLAERRKD